LTAPEKVVLRRGITRRHLLGAAGLGGLALLSKPAWSQAVLGIQPPRRQALTQPPEIRSENGVLNATLTASPGLVRLGEFAFPGFVYNDAYIPPLLRVRPGDTMRIGFRNQLPDDPSNLHYHGMSVSPQRQCLRSRSSWRVVRLRSAHPR
jgi:suppressor of ftsI